ncbi:MAG TPA: PEP/pyruvate-binding domain-containing protein, partial [Desulfobacteria bacterium]|nr:PEP/pyruvate-binding domain-containing protein [Desulfobacteria bacterium]
VEGDYVRIIALDNPMAKPYAGLDDFKGFSQRKVDLLNLRDNKLQTLALQDLVDEKIELRLNNIAERDYKSEQILEKLKGQKQTSWILTFDKLASETSFPGTMQKLLKALEKIYKSPVDVEFTVNFTDDKNYRINLLQCRPLQVHGLGARVEFPHDTEPLKVLFKGQGGFMGGNIQKTIERIVYVEPQAYSELNESCKYRVARAIGKLNRLIVRNNMSVMLLGPGRWGTTTASLGVPVNFAEISNMSILGEVAYPKAGFVPEVSYGTHFFNDLVENEIFYVALFPERHGVVFQNDLLKKLPDYFPEVLPAELPLRDVIRVYDIGTASDKKLEIAADVSLQEVICHFS